MSHVSIWLEATRPKTLPAAIAPVLLGSAMAYQVDCFVWPAALICLLFALLVQIGTNFANDYLDGIKGTDTEARLGPRRAVAAGLITPSMMRLVTIAVLAFAFCLGLTLIFYGGWWLLVVGVLSVACAWLYTGGPYPLAYNGLGDVFVVLFFGFIAVGCTYYVQVGAVSPRVYYLGLACGLLVNNILVVNNYRDVVEDTVAKKRTLVVLLGRRWALCQYVVSSAIAGAVSLFLAFKLEQWLILTGLFPVLLGFLKAVQLARAKTPEEFLCSLKAAAQIVVLYSVMTALGIVL